MSLRLYAAARVRRDHRSLDAAGLCRADPDWSGLEAVRHRLLTLRQARARRHRPLITCMSFRDWQRWTDDFWQVTVGAAVSRVSSKDPAELLAQPELEPLRGRLAHCFWQGCEVPVRLRDKVRLAQSVDQLVGLLCQGYLPTEPYSARLVERIGTYAEAKLLQEVSRSSVALAADLLRRHDALHPIRPAVSLCATQQVSRAKAVTTCVRVVAPYARTEPSPADSFDRAGHRDATRANLVLQTLDDLVLSEDTQQAIVCHVEAQAQADGPDRRHLLRQVHRLLRPGV